MMHSKKVVIALSGGVDSAVAAALLKEAGNEVIGMMLRLWSEPGTENLNRCCTPDDMAMARRIAAQLDIPFYAIDAKDEFFNAVVNPFIDGYAQGVTPNPCLNCNQQVRWTFLLNRALALGADYLATGHYARLRNTNNDGHRELLRSIDWNKDQSYVLHVLNQEQLAHAIFPLGEYKKAQVRDLALNFNLPVAKRSDSQDLCFLGKGDYRDFLKRNAPVVSNPGHIRTIAGDLIGQHLGLAFYTIGQRKGLGISAPYPLYVLEKDITSNTLFVGPPDHLGKEELVTSKVNWISGKAPKKPIKASIKIRYKAQEVDGIVSPLELGGSCVKFNKPIRDITPGQAAVFYNGEVCLGGGIIE